MRQVHRTVTGKAPYQSQSLTTPVSALTCRLGLCCFPLSRGEMHGWVSRIPEGGVSCIPEGDIFVFPQLFLLEAVCASQKNGYYDKGMTKCRSPSH